MTRARGFTLIELMVVVAIIAILASIAIAAYQRAIGKAQLSEAFTVSEGLKTDAISYLRQAGTCPSAGTGGIQSPASYSGKYVASATITSSGNGCRITLLMRSNSVTPQLRGKQVVFDMNPSGGNAQWTCSSNAPVAYLPQTCR